MMRMSAIRNYSSFEARAQKWSLALLHGRPVKSHYSSRDGGAGIRLRDRRPPDPLHVQRHISRSVQPTLHGVSSTHLRLLCDCRLIAQEPRTRRAAANSQESHVSFRCVVCPKKKRAFMTHVISYCSPLKPPRTPRATRF